MIVETTKALLVHRSAFDLSLVASMLPAERAIRRQLELAADGRVGFVGSRPLHIGSELHLDTPVGDALDRLLDAQAFLAGVRLRSALRRVGVGVRSARDLK